MMNYIWAAMILIGVVYGAITGNMQGVTNAALDSSKEAISLCITMMGIMMLWTGLMEIAEQAGIMRALTEALNLFIHFLFPKLSKDEPAKKYIAINCVANILGLGWAATPAGLKAMEALAAVEEKRSETKKRQYVYEKDKKCGKVSVASDEMCTFLILNISSLQLIPVNMIAYRSQYGSVNPAGIIAPAIIATACSTGVAILFCKIMQK